MTRVTWAVPALGCGRILNLSPRASPFSLLGQLLREAPSGAKGAASFPGQDTYSLTSLGTHFSAFYTTPCCCCGHSIENLNNCGDERCKTLSIFKVEGWGGGWCCFSHFAAYVNSALEPVQGNTDSYHNYINFEGGWLCVLVRHLFWHFQFLCLVSELRFSFIT